MVLLESENMFGTIPSSVMSNDRHHALIIICHFKGRGRLCDRGSKATVCIKVLLETDRERNHILDMYVLCLLYIDVCITQ